MSGRLAAPRAFALTTGSAPRAFALPTCSALCAFALIACSALCAAALLACGEAPPSPGPPAAPHGSVVLEPATLHVGDLVNVEIAVVTPPDHRVLPIDLSAAVPPLWLLDADRLPVRRDGERWVHVTRVRARVREAPGEYEWPSQRVSVETPEGERLALDLEGRPFVVTSASDALPDRVTPFGLRVPERLQGGGTLPTWAAALMGALGTLGALGARRLVRRRRAARRAARAPTTDGTPPWTRADEALRRALDELADDPRAAASAAAAALRRYVSERSGRSLESLTSEEIAARRPPGRLRSRWPEWVALLRRLDALRFPGRLDHEPEREALRAWLGDARAFVASSTPPRERR